MSCDPIAGTLRSTRYIFDITALDHSSLKSQSASAIPIDFVLSIDTMEVVIGCNNSSLGTAFESFNNNRCAAVLYFVRRVLDV